MKRILQLTVLSLVALMSLIATSHSASAQTYDVLLMDYAANSKVAIIKTIRLLRPELGLRESVDLIATLPATILSNVDGHTADDAQTKLEAAGGIVELFFKSGGTASFLSFKTDKAVGEEIWMRVSPKNQAAITGAKLKEGETYTLTNQRVTLEGSAITEILIPRLKISNVQLQNLTNLVHLDISENMLRGLAMDQIIAGLPQRSSPAKIFVINTQSTTEQNSFTKEQVAAAKAKGWIAMDYNGSFRREYPGDGEPFAVDLLTLTTDKKVGETINFSIIASGPVTAEGIKESIATNGIRLDYTLTSQTIKIKGPVTHLDADKTPFTAVDASECRTIKDIYCLQNKLSTLKLPKESRLTRLLCSENELTELDLSTSTELLWLSCDHNQLSTLDFSQNKKLINIFCEGNQIKGEGMDKLIASLPQAIMPIKSLRAEDDDDEMPQGGFIGIINTKDPNEGNICNKSHVAEAKAKNWTVLDLDPENEGSTPYEGSPDGTALEGIAHAELHIYPNPATDRVRITGATAYQAIRLYSLEGMLLHTTQANALGSARLELSGLPHGTYLLQVGKRSHKLTIN